MKKYVLFWLLATAALPTKLYAQGATQVTLQGTTSTNTIANNVVTVVDPNLQVTANGNLTGFTVAITDSYTTGDVLGYTGTLPSGISAASFNTTSRSLVFSGTTTTANWQDLLRRVTIRTASAVCFPERRAVSFTVGNKNYNPQTGHFYEYVSTTKTWVNAKNDAATQSYFGRAGYLATITSAAENNFIWKIMPADAWVGATYDQSQLTGAGINTYANQTAAIGNVYWVTGPERGTFISSGLSTPVAQNGQYMNWTSGEPNNWNGTNEYYVQLYSTTQGLWNDLPASSSLTSVIEYGGMPNDINTSTVLFTRNIYVNGAPGGTINGGGGSVCTGTNSTVLTISGLTGTVTRWESSLDNFLTPGTVINSTSTTYTASNLTKTTYYRAIVNSTSPASCAGLATSSVAVNVNATITGTPFADNSNICPGGNAEITLFGNDGNILQWQMSTSSTFASGNTVIANTTNRLVRSMPTAGTFYFRAQVQKNSCGSPVYSAGVRVIVAAGTAPVGGSVTSTEHCGGSNSGTLTLSGQTGTISRWQFSVDNGVIWTDVANTTSTLSYSAVTNSRLYRAVITNGSCGTVYSAVGKVTVFGNTQYKWMGGTSTDWANTANWLCGNRPVTGADIVVSNTAGNNMVLDQSYNIGNIDFSGSNIKVVLGSHNITVNSVTGFNNNNYFRTNGTGKVKMNIAPGTPELFPVGNSAYNPITITNRTNSADDFDVRVIDAVYNNGSSGSTVNNFRVNRTWDISKTTANNGSGVDFIFNWNAGEAVGVTTSRMYHYEGGGWVKQTGTTSSTATSLTYSGYTGTFSPFAVLDNMAVLAVQWQSFDGYHQNGNNHIKWSTASQLNNDYFVVEYSSNAINFIEAGRVGGGSNSSNEQFYSFVHSNIKEPILYYRIKEVDVNGQIGYSKIIRINAEKDLNTSIITTPNPTVDAVQLSIRSNKQNSTTVVVTDLSGKIIHRYQKNLVPGINTILIDLSKQASGMYFIKIKNADGQESVNKVIKQ